MTIHDLILAAMNQYGMSYTQACAHVMANLVG